MSVVGKRVEVRVSVRLGHIPVDLFLEFGGFSILFKGFAWLFDYWDLGYSPDG